MLSGSICKQWEISRLERISQFSDEKFRRELESDLREDDDSRRKMKEISVESAE